MKPGRRSSPHPSQRSRPGLGWLAAAGLFALALIVRLTVAAQLAGVVLFHQPQLDSLEYLQWAERLAAGDFPWPVPPPHGPGYPLLLGLLLRLSGGALGPVRLVQALLGAGTATLTAALAARFFGRRAGLCAGVLLALSGPLVFVEVSLLSEGPLIFLLVLALWSFVALARPVPRALAAGIALGAAALVRPTAVAVLAGLLAVLLGEIVARRQDRTAVRNAGITAGLLLATFLLIVAPVVAKISRVNRAFLPVQGFGGYAFYIGNRRDGDGLPSPRLGSGWESVLTEAGRPGVPAPVAQARY